MSFVVTCHSCGGKFTAPDEADAKFAPCPKCEARIDMLRPEEITDADLDQLFGITHTPTTPMQGQDSFPKIRTDGVSPPRTALRQTTERRTYLLPIIGTIAGAFLGFVLSYFMQPGVLRAFVPFSTYLFRSPQLLVDLFASAPEGPVARTMVLVTVGGAFVGLVAAIVVKVFGGAKFNDTSVETLRKTKQFAEGHYTAVTDRAKHLGRHARPFKPHGNILRLFTVTVLTAVALLVVLFVLNLTAPTAVRRATSLTKPAWHRSVINYLERHDRLLCIERVNRPESLDGAMLLFDEANVWLDARGGYSWVAFDPAGPGTGFCDATCEFGVRVEYYVDEGFGRTGYEDQVFFLTGDYRVTGYTPTNYVRFRGARTSDADQKEAADFLGQQGRYAPSQPDNSLGGQSRPSGPDTSQRLTEPERDNAALAPAEQGAPRFLTERTDNVLDEPVPRAERGLQPSDKRAEILRKLQQKPRPLIDQLIDALNTGDKNNVLAAIKSIRAADPACRSVQPVISQLMRDSDSESATKALWVLDGANSGADWVLEYLLPLHDDYFARDERYVSAEPISTWYRGDDPAQRISEAEVRREIIRLLARFHAKDQRVEQLFLNTIEQLKATPEPRDRAIAALWLSRSMALSDVTVPALLEAVKKDASMEVKRAALVSLAGFHDPPRPVIAVIDTGLEHFKYDDNMQFILLASLASVDCNSRQFKRAVGDRLLAYKSRKAKNWAIGPVCQILEALQTRASWAIPQLLNAAEVALARSGPFKVLSGTLKSVGPDDDRVLIFYERAAREGPLRYRVYCDSIAKELKLRGKP